MIKRMRKKMPSETIESDYYIVFVKEDTKEPRRAVYRYCEKTDDLQELSEKYVIPKEAWGIDEEANTMKILAITENLYEYTCKKWGINIIPLRKTFNL